MACFLIVAEAAPGSVPVRLAALREASLTPSEIAAVETGDVIAKTIDTDDRSEVLTVSALRVRATPEAVLAWLRGVDGWRRQPWVVQTGRLGRPPASRDLEALKLDPAEIRDLARCRVNACEIRLSREAIEAFRTRIDWSSPTAAAAASELAREILARYAAAYLSAGDAALFEYVNNDDPVHIADGFKRILSRSSFLEEAAPDVAAYLASYPNRRPADAEDFIYWMKEKFWRTSVFSLNHCTIVDRRSGGERIIIATTKQLYATHYYEASLSTTMFVAEPGGSYLVTINRTRADIRPSGFSWFERLLLNRLVRRRLEAQVQVVKLALEGEPGASRLSTGSSR